MCKLRVKINPYPTILSGALKMLSAFLCLSVYFRLHFFMKQTIWTLIRLLPLGSNLIRVHIICHIGYLRTGADDKSLTGGLRVKTSSLIWRGALHLCTSRWYLLRTVCDFNCALFSYPNQDQLVISGRAMMTCTSNCTGEIHTIPKLRNF